MGNRGKGLSEDIWVYLVFLGIGYVFGSQVEGRRKEQAALDWATETTMACEFSRRSGEYVSIVDCLKEARAKIEEERRDEAQAEGNDLNW